jgi:hypothetical protein
MVDGTLLRMAGDGFGMMGNARHLLSTRAGHGALGHFLGLQDSSKGTTDDREGENGK